MVVISGRITHSPPPNFVRPPRSCCHRLNIASPSNSAFQIVDPTTLGFDYELALNDAENAILQSPAPEDVVVMQVLFRNEEGGKASISPNLRAPLVINTRTRVGIQKVMENLRPNIILSNLTSPV